MAVESILLLAEEAGQTKIRDLQVSRRADEEVGGLQVLAADRKRFIVEGNIKTLFLKNEQKPKILGETHLEGRCHPVRLRLRTPLTRCMMLL